MASQSSSSGWLGAVPVAPKFPIDLTKPLPKWCFQILFTMLAATILHAVTNQSVDIVLAMLLIVGGVFGAQFGARAGRNLQGEAFRLFLALLVLGVGVRFAIEVVVRPCGVNRSRIGSRSSIERR